MNTKVLDFNEVAGEEYSYLYYTVRIKINSVYQYAEVEDRVKDGIFCGLEPKIVYRRSGEDVECPKIRSQIMKACNQYHINQHQFA